MERERKTATTEPNLKRNENMTELDKLESESNKETQNNDISSEANYIVENISIAHNTDADISCSNNESQPVLENSEDIVDISVIDNRNILIGNTDNAIESFCENSTIIGFATDSRSGNDVDIVNYSGADIGDNIVLNRVGTATEACSDRNVNIAINCDKQRDKTNAVFGIGCLSGGPLKDYRLNDIIIVSYYYKYNLFNSVKQVHMSHIFKLKLFNWIKTREF